MQSSPRGFKMKKSTLFKQAHALTKATIKTGDNYRATFGLAIKAILSQAKKSFAEILLDLGLKVWEKGSMKRIYINKASQFYAFAKEANLDDATVSAYAHFAKRIDSNKTWFDLNTNKFASEKTTVNTLFSVLSI